MRQALLVVHLLFLISAIATAQHDRNTADNRRPWTVTAGHQVGMLLPVEPFLRGENLSGAPLTRFGATTASFLVRTAGHREWERRHGRPELGFGLTFLHYHNRRELGRPVALHRSFLAPLWERDGIRLAYGADIGLAAGWRRYDADRNPFNKLISTYLTAYFRLRVAGKVPLSDHFALQLDAGLTHVSNGNVKRPNAGLNAVSAGIGLRYAIREVPPAVLPPLPRFSPYTDLSISFFGGVEKRLYQTENLPPSEKYRGLTHGLGGIAVTVGRRLSYGSKIGLGGSLMYHDGNRVSAWTEDGQLHHHAAGSVGDRLRLGVFPSYELIFHRWSVMVQAEYYVVAPGDMNPVDRFRQRLGLKYRLSDRVYLATLVNARQFSVADFVEWHVGYTLTGSRRRGGSD
ncbi:lipid A 3-O-deacylase PagL [Neolewinella xylanilytica]|uniref:Lipid A 3-O-deacylase PagL n=1 Tax=Neolewinella xylanilytica TaxID=1514080 RepID=A0A2S6IA54_9BACT|nr:acyloxyacyl hydrolase [Neolewinella xylanilytica]PPK88383.1 lipid A 3-O-deacylase PagL [Neolewinella xylanilytica]